MDQVSEIRDRTPRIPGAFAKAQTWAVLAVALIIMLVIWLNSSPPSKPVAPKPGATHQTPTSAEQAATLQKEIDSSTRNLREENQRLADAKQRAAIASSIAAANPSPAVPPYVSYQPPQQIVQQAPPAVEKDTSASGVVSFRHGATIGAQLPAPTGPLAPEQMELRRLIDAQRQALQSTLQATNAPPVLPPAPQPHAALQPEKTRAEVPNEEDLKKAIGKSYRVFEDTMIESVLENRLNGSFVGPVIVQVSSPVYSHDLQHVLIPKGSRVLGEAQRVNQQGQQRLAVLFHRIIMPDGYSVSLDQFIGANEVGETGLKDKVDNHWVQIFGTSIALGIIQGFSVNGTGSALTSGGLDQARQGVAGSLSQSSTRILDSKLNLLPNIVIRPGHRVRVFIRQDLELPAYENHRIPGDV